MAGEVEGVALFGQAHEKVAQQRIAFEIERPLGCAKFLPRCTEAAKN
jgi:hypothetical protein